MVSIRTALVVVAFVGMGLTSTAEYLAGTAFADPDPITTVGAGEVLPRKALRLTQKTLAAAASIDLSPWN